MANTTFQGPVRSENGFKDITKAASTGTSRRRKLFLSLTTVLTALLSSKIFPLSDPSVAGQLYSNSGVLTVSAG